MKSKNKLKSKQGKVSRWEEETKEVKDGSERDETGWKSENVTRSRSRKLEEKEKIWE